MQGSDTTSPRPWQVGQVRSMWKKPPWLARTRPAPLQVGQVFGLVPGFAPEPEQTSQVTRGRHLDLDGLAGKGLLQRDLEIVAEVGAALAAGAALPPPRKSPKNSSKMSAKEAKPAAPRRRQPPVLEGLVAEAVIGGALLRILQDLVGLVDLLELHLGGMVAAVAVGMKLHGELAEGAFQLLLVAAARDAEHLVEIAFRHRESVKSKGKGRPVVTGRPACIF